jgi:acyl-lipid omega-6 desaturase (Delta-12 desaturase)
MNFNSEEVLNDLKDWQKMIRKYQVPDTTKATIQVVNSFAIFFGLWALQFYLLPSSVWWVVGIALFNGLILGGRIFIIQHDCGHKSFTRSRNTNNIIGTICSTLTCIPFNYWAANHDYHHAHNGQLEVSDVGDVQCYTAKEYANLSIPAKIRYRIYRSPFYLFTIGGFMYVALHNRFAFLREGAFEKVWKTVKWSNFLFIAVYAILGFVMGKSFFVVQGINLAFFGIYALWFFYIQHQYENIYKAPKENWNYVISAVKGSTYYDLPAIGHWLTGNIGFHHIHHLSPTIPNYNLQACNKEYPVFEKHTHKLTIMQSFKCVFANLWDSERNKMISFGEYKSMKKDLLAK